MQVFWFVPLGNDIGPSCLGGLNNRACVGTVIGIDVNYAIATGLREDRLNVGNAFFTVALSHQRYIFSANCLSKRCAAFVPGRMIRIGQ